VGGALDKDLVDRIDETLHDLFQAMNLDRIPIQREYGKFSAKNLSLMEIRILRAIDDHDQMALKDIRARVQLPNSTLTSIIKKFEAKHLVLRIPNPEDGRSYILKITKKGRLINREHRQVDRLIAQNFLARLGGEKAAEDFVRITNIATRTPLFSMDEYYGDHDEESKS
jgi:DNA-binding MarR family transcriptional regulator